MRMNHTEESASAEERKPEAGRSPLDLEQFGPTLANPDAAALLEECRRQRAEIARLRNALLLKATEWGAAAMPGENDDVVRSYQHCAEQIHTILETGTGA